MTTPRSLSRRRFLALATRLLVLGNAAALLPTVAVADQRRAMPHLNAGASRQTTRPAAAPAMNERAALPPLLELLRLVPDTPNHRRGLHLNDIALLAAQAGATPPQASDGAETAGAYADALFTAGIGNVPGVSGLDIRAERRWAFRRYLGFHAGLVTHTAWTGVQPDMTAIMLGSFDPSATERGLASCGDCVPIERREYHGIRYYTHGDDLELAIELVDAPPGFDDLGRFGRLVVQEQRIAHTQRTSAIEAAIDTGLGQRPSLADDEAFRLLAAGAVASGAYGLFLTSDTATQAATRPSEDRDNVVRGREHLLALAVDPSLLLRQYDVVMLGGGRADGRPYLIIGLAHASEESARANVEILPERIAHVVEFRRERPWRDLVRVRDIRAEGRLLLARLDMLDSKNTRLWLDLWDWRDNLLYFGD